MNPREKYATETRRHGDRDKKTRRQGAREKGRRGNVEAGRLDLSLSLSSILLVSHSPCLLVPPSLLISVAPWLRGKRIGLAATMAVALSFANACSEAPGKASELYLESRPATIAANEPEPPRV